MPRPRGIPQGGTLVDAWIASAFHLVTERRDGMPECLGRRLDGIIRLIFCTDVGCRHLETRLHHTLPQDRDSGTSSSDVSSHRWSVTEEHQARRVEDRGPTLCTSDQHSPHCPVPRLRLCDATLLLPLVNCSLLVPSPSARPKHPLDALSPSDKFWPRADRQLPASQLKPTRPTSTNLDCRGPPQD